MKRLFKLFAKVFLFGFFGLIFSIIICSIFNACYADTIRCYSGAQMVYEHNVRDVSYTGGMFIFVELPSNVVGMYSGDCLVKIKP